MSTSFVNKLTVDRDDAFSQEPKTVHVLVYNGNQLAHRNMRKFMEVVYRNFEELADVNVHNHTRREIARLLTSPKSTIIIATINGQIVAYLIAEITVVENLRQLMHIVYLYTSPVYRAKGIA